MKTTASSSNDRRDRELARLECEVRELERLMLTRITRMKKRIVKLKNEEE